MEAGIILPTTKANWFMNIVVAQIEPLETLSSQDGTHASLRKECCTCITINFPGLLLRKVGSKEIIK
jgi:hypothetical protein